MHKSTLQSAQHPLTKDHQTRGSSMQSIHYLRLIAFAGVSVKNELKFLCSLYSSKYLHRMRNCLKVLNHLGCSRTPFIMYAAAAAWKLARFGSVCNWKALAFVLIFYSVQQSLNRTSAECWWSWIDLTLQIKESIYINVHSCSLHKCEIAVSLS